LQELQQILTENGFACAAGGEVAYGYDLNGQACLFEDFPVVELVSKKRNKPIAASHRVE
jgi:hypothetical protein